MASSQLQKVETTVHIKASPEQFHEVFSRRTKHMPNICPDIIKAVEINEGEWGTEGSIITWHYLLEGKASMCKEVVESIDKKNNKLIMKVIEGDVLAHYKSFRSTVQATPKENGSEVNWVLEYEIQNDHKSEPQSLLQLAVKLSKGVDAYLTQNKE